VPKTAEEMREIGRQIAEHEVWRRRELARELRELCGLGDVGDPEHAHTEADRLLLDFIDDDEVRAAFEAVPKWYA
jgi:hypothetical protein